MSGAFTMEEMNMHEFETLLGKTLAKIIVSEDKDRVTFVTDDGARFDQSHDQDCCESVTIGEIVGDLSDVVGSPILLAEEVTHKDETPAGVAEPEWADDSFTWTFYKLSTIKGSVMIRWLGTSNGYYSESVSFGRAA